MSRTKAPPKVYSGFCNGMLVRKFQRWGDNAGKVDMNGIFKIRAMTESSCILDRLDSETLQKVPYRRGRRTSLYNQSDAERYMGGNRRNIWDYPYSWSHVFTQVGQEGWDPDF